MNTLPLKNVFSLSFGMPDNFLLIPNMMYQVTETALYMPWVWRFLLLFLEVALCLIFVILVYWRRKWQPTAMFLPGKSHGWRRSLAGYSLWGCKKSGITRWESCCCFFFLIVVYMPMNKNSSPVLVLSPTFLGLL